MDKFLRSGDGFLLIYTITLKSSFDELAAIREQVLRARDGDECPMIYVGNKCDLEDLREVNKVEAEELAKENNSLFIESSAKEKINVELIFTTLVKEIIKKRGDLDDKEEQITEKIESKKGCCTIL